MCYQDDPERFVLVKIDKIMGIANPIHELVKQYIRGVEEMYMFDEEEDLTPDGKEDPWGQWEGSDSDDGKSNVLKFPTIH